MATYEEPMLKGQGPSTASQTAWALMGLIACGDLSRESPALDSGISSRSKTERFVA